MLKVKENPSDLYEMVISPQNIYNAIYSLESYVFEKGLLSIKDRKAFDELHDKYNFALIDKVINKCQEKLKVILNSNELFDIQVYFKMKKYDKDNGEIAYRPIHTADLITQICIVSLLNVIIFDDRSGHRKLSDVSELLPSNFYGNIPSTNVKNIFYDWRTMYKEYSENVISAYNLYQKTREYKYEVCLDLKNFFPSINPHIIYNLIFNKLSVVFNDDEMWLEIILKKLLFFNITNISECLKEYYPEEIIDAVIKSNIFPSLGIPQGLPQAYFFGNVCMAEISKIIKKTFNGKDFYYVDDSVIYTNSKNAENPEKFIVSIQKLNIQINEQFKEIMNVKKCIENKFNHYQIEIHADEKSISSDIQRDKKYGRKYLKQINLGASGISFDIATVMDELQNETILKKTQLYLRAIEDEIDLIENKMHKAKNIKAKKNSRNLDENNLIEALKAYLKLLKRYKKFFLFRMKIIELSKEDLKESDLKEYYKKYHIDNNTKFSTEYQKEILDKFEEDIFEAEASLLIKFTNDKVDKKNIYEKISSFEHNLSKMIPTKNLYYTKTLKYSIYTHKEYNQYSSLLSMECKYLRDYRKYSQDKVIEVVLEMINSYTQVDKESLSIDKKANINDKINFLGFSFKKYSEFILVNSNDYKRKVLNCLISKQFSVDVSNDTVMFKINNQIINYFELRILAYVRNIHSDFNKTISFIYEVITEAKKNHTHDKIDYSIMEVLKIFNIYVKDSEYIDQLINTHKYVMSVWKNGSKNLYFYTLHNQEHSVELIRSSISICKSIDFFKIKSIDYYVLFLACYLHDISMILQPDFNLFITNENDAELMVTEWEQEYRKMHNESIAEPANENILIKSFILEWYKRVDSYFENEIRGKHVKNSANFIKNTFDLNYIECAIKNIVANVSESHGFDDNDVYGLKSKGQSEAINVKFLMILLRLADVMDMSKDRVSLNIMKINMEQMNDISKYHWISHAAIDSCIIKSDYEYDPEGANGTNTDIKGKVKMVATYLNKAFFKEKVSVHLYLNTQNLTQVDSRNCKRINCKLENENNTISLQLFNKIGSETNCDAKSCNFMCKWMCDKNEYLIKELQAIDRYLSRNQDNNFSTDIYIKIHMENTAVIPEKYLGIVLARIK